MSVPPPPTPCPSQFALCDLTSKNLQTTSGSSNAEQCRLLYKASEARTFTTGLMDCEYRTLCCDEQQDSRALLLLTPPTQNKRVIAHGLLQSSAVLWLQPCVRARVSLQGLMEQVVSYELGRVLRRCHWVSGS